MELWNTQNISSAHFTWLSAHKDASSIARSSLLVDANVIQKLNKKNRAAIVLLEKSTGFVELDHWQKKKTSSQVKSLLLSGLLKAAQQI